MAQSRQPAAPRGVQPYDWALKQLCIDRAHQVCRGSEDVPVAVIDLGYRHHPALDGRLWVNPRPTRGDIHGWDFADDDASLEYNGPEEDTSEYYRGHHVFVAGEVAAVAPGCPLMILRWSYANPASLARAIRYAVEHGARVLVIPHGYLTGGLADGVGLFYRGTDFTFPQDNPDLRNAIDDACKAGCLLFSGTADNRGRRVAFAPAALESVVAVGSSNRDGQAADICCSADYVEIAAPGGERHSDDPRDRIWGYGGDGPLVAMTGGCMACGFAGGVAALVWSRHPQLTADQLRQVLRNTARGSAWDDRLGWGLLDAARAASLEADDLTPRLRIDRRGCEFRPRRNRPVLRVTISNRGALDIRRAVVVAYDGDPRKPAAPKATMESPVILKTRQLGHAAAAVRGLHRTELDIELTTSPRKGRVWLEAYITDRHTPAGLAHTSVAVDAS
jgi:hypothetical protein